MSQVKTPQLPRTYGGFEYVRKQLATRAFDLIRRWTLYLYIGGVRVGERTSRMVNGIADFGHMRTDQIVELYYPTSKSPSTWHGRLSRLIELGTLSKVPYRLQDSPRGGSPMGCYQIGKTSWRTFYGDTKYEAVKDQHKLEHTLFNVDIYILAKRLERQGLLTFIEASVEEPITAAGVIVKADQFWHLNLLRRSETGYFWIEADTDNENKSKIQTKIHNYVHLLNSGEYVITDDDGHERFPEVIFVVKDGEGATARVRELKRWIAEIENVPEWLFTVVTYSDLPQLLM